jgi:hypothetical protein
LDDAIHALDRLEEAAATSQTAFAFGKGEGFENLAAIGLGHVLASRLGDKKRPPTQRRLLLDVSRVNKCTETANVAEAIIGDPNEPPDLRTWACVLLSHVGSDKHFRGLEGLVRSVKPTSRDEYTLVCLLVHSLYDRGLWSFMDAAEYVPPVGSPAVEAMSMLERRLLRDMKVADARDLVGASDWESLLLKGLERGRQTGHFVDRGQQRLLRAAIELIARQDQLAPEDCRLLLPMVFSDLEHRAYPPVHVDFVELFQTDRDARRGLFLAGLEKDPAGEGNDSWKWRGILASEDLDWLIGICKERGHETPFLWNCLIRLAYLHGVPQNRRQAIRKQVRRANLGAVKKFDEARRLGSQRDKEHRERQRQLRARREAGQVRLEKLIDDTLKSREIDVQGQMLRLAWLCFAGEWDRPTNVIGEWQDLDETRKNRVVARCESALRECSPIPIPDQDTYPGGIVYQAEAFAKVLETSATFILDVDMIQKWLQSLLIFSIPDREEALLQCLDADRSATEEVIVREMHRQLRLDGGTVNVARNLPERCWSDQLLSRALELVEDENLNLGARGDLLRVVTERSPQHARSVAGRWATARGRKGKARECKRVVGIDALLVADPPSAVAELRQRHQSAGKEVLLAMSCLVQPRFGLAAAPETWDVPSLESLTEMLYGAFPPESDRERVSGEVYSVGPDDELRRLRGQLPVILFDQGTPDALAALGRLAEKYPSLREWHEREDARKAATGVLKSLTVPDGIGPTSIGLVKIPDVVRLLEDVVYRLIRSSHDLQRVLIEEIGEIEKDVKRHLGMLYGPAPGRKRLHEEALQAYFYCRLTDRLPGRVLGRGTQTVLEREPLAARNQRLDIKVQAPTVDQCLATVIIEVKWSDNDTVSTALVEQLATDYLIDQDLTHGIYLVGWYKPGSWRRNALGTRPRRGMRHSPEAWARALQSQVEEFQKANSDIAIVPRVVDLTWDQGQD